MVRMRPACRPATLPPGVAALDAFDLDVLAEAEVLSVLTTAGTAPLPERQLTQMIGPPYRTAVPAVLARLAGQGAVVRSGDADEDSPCWQLAPAR